MAQRKPSKPAVVQGIDWSAVGARITKARENAGLTQRELAAMLEVTPSRVSVWENGGPVSTEHLPRLCASLGVTAEQLWHGMGYSGSGEEPEVKSQALRKLRESDEWKRLPLRKRHALVELMDDVDAEDWQVKAALKLLLGETPPER